MDTARYWVGFTLVPGIGPVRLRRLLDHFGDIERAWRADPHHYARAGLDAKLAEALVAARGRVDLDEQMRRIARHGVDILTWDDSRYPERLKHIYASPSVLYLKGEILPQDDWSIAVIGTRRASIYGKQVTEQLVAGLVANHITILSGLARGIDSYAHQACLDAGGRTIAVLGSGLDVIYPPENARLARRIIDNGALLSEYPLGTKPDANNFPQRNRIVSGMSLGTLVVEGDTGSGAMLTAGFALDQGREVFAVPGSIFHHTSKGTNKLIQRGAAKLVVTAQDILEELNLTMAPQQMEMRELLPENPAEAAVLRALSVEPVHIDEICRASGLAISEVSASLAMMELKGMVKHLGGMNYVLGQARRAK
ncbi:MAG: DNA-protecting protein DprA [Chloroflexi bacterium]|nr:DNA-protecting protein DprA [Chloroflexota bacterium]